MKCTQLMLYRLYFKILPKLILTKTCLVIIGNQACIVFLIKIWFLSWKQFQKFVIHYCFNNADWAQQLKNKILQ